MKCISAILLSVITLQVAIAQVGKTKNTPKAERVAIEGKYIGELQAAKKIYLFSTVFKGEKASVLLDSSIVKRGKFKFRTENLAPGKYELKDDNNKSFTVYLDFGTTNVFVDKSFLKPRIENNAIDSLLRRYSSSKTMLGMSQLAFAIKANEYKKKNEQMPEEERKMYLDNFDKVSIAHKDLTKYLGKRADLIGAYVLSNGGDAEFSLLEMKDIYAQMPIAVQSSPFGVDLAMFLNKLGSIEIGSIAPDFVQNSIEGESIRLSEYVKNKKYVLLDFWASWCKPCRAENPHVLAIYNMYKDSGLDVLSVSIDSKEDDWRRAVEEDKLPWAQVSDLKGGKNEAAQLYNVTAIPFTLLLDSNGKIIAKNLRGDDLKAKVEELLK